MSINCTADKDDYGDQCSWQEVKDSEEGSTFVQVDHESERTGGVFLVVVGGVLIVYLHAWGGVAIADDEFFSNGNYRFTRINLNRITLKLRTGD